MSGLAIFLIVLLAVFLVVSIILLVMIITLTRQISHVQKNVKDTHQRVSGIMNSVSAASSAIALVGGLLAKSKKSGKVKHGSRKSK